MMLNGMVDGGKNEQNISHALFTSREHKNEWIKNINQNDDDSCFYLICKEKREKSNKNKNKKQSNMQSAWQL